MGQANFVGRDWALSDMATNVDRSKWDHIKSSRWSILVLGVGGGLNLFKICLDW